MDLRNIDITVNGNTVTVSAGVTMKFEELLPQLDAIVTMYEDKFVYLEWNQQRIWFYRWGGFGLQIGLSIEMFHALDEYNKNA